MPQYREELLRKLEEQRAIQKAQEGIDAGVVVLPKPDDKITTSYDEEILKKQEAVKDPNSSPMIRKKLKIELDDLYNKRADLVIEQRKKYEEFRKNMPNVNKK